MYYDDADLPGVLNLRHDRADELAPTVLPHRDAFIVVYCSDSPLPELSGCQPAPRGGLRSTRRHQKC